MSRRSHTFFFYFLFYFFSDDVRAVRGSGRCEWTGKTQVSTQIAGFGRDRGGNGCRWHVSIGKIQQIGGRAGTSKSYFVHFFDLYYWGVRGYVRNGKGSV